jgi:hypothetical protein
MLVLYAFSKATDKYPQQTGVAVLGMRSGPVNMMGSLPGGLFQRKLWKLEGQSQDFLQQSWKRKYYEKCVLTISMEFWILNNIYAHSAPFWNLLILF